MTDQATEEGGVNGAATVASLAVTPYEGALVRPAASLEATIDAFHDYQSLYTKLLVDADFQMIAGKRFPKKSAWRKLSVAFGVGFSIKERIYERDERGRIIFAEFVIVATAPNGRAVEGWGACDAFERCCPPGCRKGGKHTHCTDDCPGWNHFSNSQHDIPATAETRAKNRAASDLFGMGEVSAEEMSEVARREAEEAEGWWGGWESETEARAEFDPLFERYKALSKDAREPIRAWATTIMSGWPSLLPKESIAEFRRLLHIAESPPPGPEGPDGGGYRSAKDDPPVDADLDDDERPVTVPAVDPNDPLAAPFDKAAAERLSPLITADQRAHLRAAWYAVQGDGRIAMESTWAREHKVGIDQLTVALLPVAWQLVRMGRAIQACEQAGARQENRRHALVRYATGGAKDSTRDLSDAEVDAVMAAAALVRDGRLEFTGRGRSARWTETQARAS